jgi:hypothetical protein
LKGWRGKKSKRFLARLSVVGKVYDPPIKHEENELRRRKGKLTLSCERARALREFNKES